jgi:hypothetical protein
VPSFGATAPCAPSFGATATPSGALNPTCPSGNQNNNADCGIYGAPKKTNPQQKLLESVRKYIGPEKKSFQNLTAPNQSAPVVDAGLMCFNSTLKPHTMHVLDALTRSEHAEGVYDLHEGGWYSVGVIRYFSAPGARKQDWEDHMLRVFEGALNCTPCPSKVVGRLLTNGDTGHWHLVILDLSRAGIVYPRLLIVNSTNAVKNKELLHIQKEYLEMVGATINTALKSAFNDAGIGANNQSFIQAEDIRYFQGERVPSAANWPRSYKY